MEGSSRDTLECLLEEIRDLEQEKEYISTQIGEIGDMDNDQPSAGQEYQELQECIEVLKSRIMEMRDELKQERARARQLRMEQSDGTATIDTTAQITALEQRLGERFSMFEELERISDAIFTAEDESASATLSQTASLAEEFISLHMLCEKAREAEYTSRTSYQQSVMARQEYERKERQILDDIRLEAGRVGSEISCLEQRLQSEIGQLETDRLSTVQRSPGVDSGNLVQRGRERLIQEQIALKTAQSHLESLQKELEAETMETSPALHGLQDNAQTRRLLEREIAFLRGEIDGLRKSFRQQIAMLSQ